MLDLTHLLFEAASHKDHLLTDLLFHFCVYILRHSLLFPLLHEAYFAVETKIHALLSLHLQNDIFAGFELGIVGGEIDEFVPLRFLLGVESHNR